MAKTWAQFRTELRRSMLKDETARTWKDEPLLDAYKWSQDTFCAHTALHKEAVYDASTAKPGGGTYNMGVDTVFALPDDIYAPVEQQAFVTIENSAGRAIIITSARHTYDANYGDSMTYTMHPFGFKLAQPPGNNTTLRVQYFAYYPHPSVDTDELTVPRWSLLALAYLTSAVAMSPLAARSANISQWKEKPEAGNPEDNALRAQHQFYMGEYEKEILKYPFQDRVNFWREKTTL